MRINSEGVKLNQADFILTLMSVHWEKGRRQLEDFSRRAVDPAVTGVSPKNPFIDPSPDQLLRIGVAVAFRRARLQHVYNLLRGKDLDTGLVSAERRSDQFERLASAQERVLDLTNWHEFLKCLQAAGYRSRKMISAETPVLFSYAFWLIGRANFGLPREQLRRVIARWFFMVHTTGRYTSSAESQMEADLGRVADLTPGDGPAFVAELDRIIRSNFTNDYWEITLPTRLDTASARSPALFAYLAALNLLDAEALFSDVRVRDLLDPSVTAPRAIERHHLFPKHYLATMEITSTRQTNAIANMAHLDWAENGKISGKPPTEYWPIMRAQVADDRMARQIELHALPVGWEQLDYGTFLDRRRPLIAKVVRMGFDRLSSDGAKPKEHRLVEDLIATGESQTVEFKSSWRWNVKASMVDPALEHVVVKTVCGFLNAEGGQLLIGVDDDGVVLGLDVDLNTLGSKPTLDGYELALRQRLESSLSISTAGTVNIHFPEFRGTQICQVSVAASGKPAFATPGKGGGGAASEFWVRMGNQTRQLHGSDMLDYQSAHWG